MTYVEVMLVVIGVILLVVGYRKSNRNLMLTAAIVLFLSMALPDFVEGMRDGWRDAGRDKTEADGSR